MVNFELPSEPQPENYEQEFTFRSYDVDTSVTETKTFKVPSDAQFVGVVQMANSPVYRTVFMSRKNEYDKAALEYNTAIDNALDKARELGVDIKSYEELIAWAASEHAPETPENLVDFAAIKKAVAAEQA